VRPIVLLAAMLAMLLAVSFAAAESVSYEELGVVATTAGFMHGKEVVEVMFNSEKISYTELLRRAMSNGVARNAYVFSKEQENAFPHHHAPRQEVAETDKPY